MNQKTAKSREAAVSSHRTSPFFSFTPLAALCSELPWFGRVALRERRR